MDKELKGRVEEWLNIHTSLNTSTELMIIKKYKMTDQTKKEKKKEEIGLQEKTDIQAMMKPDSHFDPTI